MQQLFCETSFKHEPGLAFGLVSNLGTVRVRVSRIPDQASTVCRVLLQHQYLASIGTIPGFITNLHDPQR